MNDENAPTAQGVSDVFPPPSDLQDRQSRRDTTPDATTTGVTHDAAMHAARHAAIANSLAQQRFVNARLRGSSCGNDDVNFVWFHARQSYRSRPCILATAIGAD